MASQPGFFDVDARRRRLSHLGDQLEAFGRVVDIAVPAFGTQSHACIDATMV